MKDIELIIRKMTAEDRAFHALRALAAKRGRYNPIKLSEVGKHMYENYSIEKLIEFCPRQTAGREPHKRATRVPDRSQRELEKMMEDLVIDLMVDTITDDPDIVAEAQLDDAPDPKKLMSQLAHEWIAPSNYGEFWRVLEDTAKTVPIDHLKEFVLAAFGADVGNREKLLCGNEKCLVKVFGMDPEIWQGWIEWMGRDAEMEIAYKASDYYMWQGDLVRGMLQMPPGYGFGEINWHRVLELAESIYGDAPASAGGSVIDELYWQIGQEPPSEED